MVDYRKLISPRFQTLLKFEWALSDYIHNKPDCREPVRAVQEERREMDDNRQSVSSEVKDQIQQNDDEYKYCWAGVKVSNLTLFAAPI